MYKSIFFLAAFPLAFLSACADRDPDSPGGPGVWVRFHNDTPDDLKNARMVFMPDEETPIGAISAGVTSDYVLFEAFQVGTYEGGDYKFPQGRLVAEVNGQEIGAWSGNWCGTGVVNKNLPEGEYTIRVKKEVNGGFTYYYMDFE